MKVSYYLTRPNVETETGIYARICYKGLKVKFYLPETIAPKFWNKETQRAKTTQKFREFPEFNARLNNIDSSIKTVFRRFVNDNDGVMPQPGTLIELLNQEIKKIEQIKEQKHTFCSFLSEIISHSEKGARLNPKSGKAISKNTIKTYNTLYKHLQKFEETRKRQLQFADITLDFHADYTEFLINTYKLSANAIGKDFQIIKLIMNEATERGVNENLAFKSKRFVIPREQSDNIYITENEIREIYGLNLTDNARLEKVRDLFVIGCYTGLRFSDYSILNPEKIKDGSIEITQTKTGAPVVIPIHSTVKSIIEKYNGSLPAAISNQKTNEYLKEIGKMVNSLNDPFIKTMTKGGLKNTRSLAKWELLSTHTVRRSFATNEFLAGTPTLTIMAITGHKTEKDFLRYIKVTSNEQAKLLKLSWDKRENEAKLKAV